jgi:hypothetical protein
MLLNIRSVVKKKKMYQGSRKGNFCRDLYRKKIWRNAIITNRKA